MAPLQSVFCARTTQPKVTPTNHHLLIDIHHRRFSLGHQGLPRLHQSLEKPPASTKQEGYGEGGGVGGGEEAAVVCPVLRGGHLLSVEYENLFISAEI